MTKKSRKTAIAAAAGLLAGAVMITAGCAGKPPAHEDVPIKVITVNFPPYDFVKQITGGEIVPEMLLKGGQDAHSFEPTAKEMIRINEADIFICTGGESDAWVDRIADSIDGGVRIVRMTDYTDVIEEDHDEDEHGHEDHADNGEEHEHEYDEHVWTSPKRVESICQGITDVLCEVYPEKADKYRSGLESYKAELSALSDELKITAGELESPLIFGDRFPFLYMAHDYGIEYAAAFSGCSTDTEPSAAKMGELIDLAGKEHAEYIYYIEFSTKKIASAIAEAVGAETRLMHSCHTVSDDDIAAGETYISIMKRNIAAMKQK